MRATFCALMLLLLHPVAAAPSAVQASMQFPSLDALFAPPKDFSALSGKEIITAALDLSLCPQNSAAYRATLEKYSALEACVTTESFLQLPEAERAEKVLLLLYEDTLLRYNIKQSRLDVLFAEGVYNCVSASVCYAALAVSAKLRVVGNLTPNHAFCSVFVGENKIDVETTNPAGFNPGSKKPVQTNGGKTAYFIVPKNFYANKREVSLPMLVAAIGNNMCSTLDEKRDYATAIPLAAACFPFARTESEMQSVRAVFDTLCGNYSNRLTNADRNLQAAAWLKSVYARYGETAYLREYFDVAANNAIADFCNAGNYAAARAFLEENKSYIPEKTFADLDAAVFVNAANAEITALSDEAAFVRLEKLRKDPRASAPSAKKRFDELSGYLWYQKARALADKQEFIAAATVAETALRELPGNRNLQTLKEQALKNHAVLVHNRFAALANAGRYQEALSVIEAGLAENPASAILQKDAESAKKALQGSIR